MDYESTALPLSYGPKGLNKKEFTKFQSFSDYVIFITRQVYQIFSLFECFFQATFPDFLL